MNLEQYKEHWDTLPWYYKLYSNVYHFFVLKVFMRTGWRPKWLRNK